MRDNEATKLKIRQCTTYAADFKKSVILYAEQNGNREARRKFGVCESNIRRWKRLKFEIFEKVALPRRRSARNIHSYKEESLDDDDIKDLLDSMPLDQRLKQVEEAESIPESVLQSQPLSPTKLKVTRQKPAPSSPQSQVNEEVCLRWNSHHVNMQKSFPSLLSKEQYVDVTLVTEGKTLKCHRIILSSCSPYFDEILSGISPYQHPVLFMKDIPFWILKSLLDFMYAGEVHIYQNKLQDLLNIAELLKIKGLAGKKNDEADANKNENTEECMDEEKNDKHRKEQIDEKKRKFEEKRDEKARKDDKPRKEERPVQKVQHDVTNKLDTLDPLDLLEPIYEEPTKEVKPKIKEYKHSTAKKTFPRKLKKRKYVDLHEDSPPPVFNSRKGTRSRPNIKVPKFYHPHYESKTKTENVESNEDVIERQPHADAVQEPFIVPEIKSEPIDYENDVVEFQDNNVRFSEDDEGDTIVGNYDSSLENMEEKDLSTKHDDETSSSDPLTCYLKDNNSFTITNVESIPESSNDTMVVNKIEINSLEIRGKKSEKCNTPETLPPVDIIPINTSMDNIPSLAARCSPEKISGPEQLSQLNSPIRNENVCEEELITPSNEDSNIADGSSHTPDEDSLNDDLNLQGPVSHKVNHDTAEISLDDIDMEDVSRTKSPEFAEVLEMSDQASEVNPILTEDSNNGVTDQHFDETAKLLASNLLNNTSPFSNIGSPYYTP